MPTHDTADELTRKYSLELAFLTEMFGKTATLEWDGGNSYGLSVPNPCGEGVLRFFNTDLTGEWYGPGEEENWPADTKKPDYWGAVLEVDYGVNGMFSQYVEETEVVAASTITTASFRLCEKMRKYTDRALSDRWKKISERNPR